MVSHESGILINPLKQVLRKPPYVILLATSPSSSFYDMTYCDVSPMTMGWRIGKLFFTPTLHHRTSCLATSLLVFPLLTIVRHSLFLSHFNKLKASIEITGHEAELGAPLPVKLGGDAHRGVALSL